MDRSFPGTRRPAPSPRSSPGKHVVFTWGWEESRTSDEASTVTITLEPRADGTMVRLVHDGLTGEQVASHAEGWNTTSAGWPRRPRTATRARRVGRGPAGIPTRSRRPWPPWPSASASCTRLGEADYGRPPSAPDFTVAHLADHLIGSVTGLAAAAGAESFPTPPRPPWSQAGRGGPAALEAWNAAGWTGRSERVPASFPPTSARASSRSSSWSTPGTSPRPPASRSPSPIPRGALIGIARTVITPEGRRRGASPTNCHRPGAGPWTGSSPTPAACVTAAIRPHS